MSCSEPEDKSHFSTAKDKLHFSEEQLQDSKFTGCMDRFT